MDVCLPLTSSTKILWVRNKKILLIIFWKSRDGNIWRLLYRGKKKPTGKIRGRKSSLDFGFHTHFLFLADLSPCPPPNTWNSSMKDNSGCKRTGWGGVKSGTPSSGFFRIDYKISWDNHKTLAEVFSFSQASQLLEFQWRTDDSKSM